ncbi:MAG TPA: gliding motility-associated C-terminal domain-containing protein, partial [Phnomibacter sp.]|nr:gliding motility-associated C-terminal domain-containing protein [Phnomibacter sp.]
LYAVVNDSGITRPLVLPNSKNLEKNYANNVVGRNYVPEPVLLSPQDTTIFRGDSFVPVILTRQVDPSTTRWTAGSGYALSCTQCPSPTITATQPVHIPVETVNEYGCLMQGVLRIKIFPPDFTLAITNTECITNNTTRVHFTICMNNGYDTVWKGIPVTFYEGNPGRSSARRLNTVFITPALQPAPCADYQHLISSPHTNDLYAVVNDKGDMNTTAFDAAFDETNYTNNLVHAGQFKRFRIFATPNDTTIDRAGSVQIFTSAEGGQLKAASWHPSPFLSCTNCLHPIISPTYTDQYKVTGQNEYSCTDTAWVTIRTITGGDVYIPNAFTPNGDRLNDIFYVMGNAHVESITSFRVYTRYGDVVFERHQFPPNDPVYGWDGMVKGNKGVPGAYVYQVQARFSDGTTHLYKGTVVLIR